MEHPVQRLFLAIDSQYDLPVYRGDSYDAFTNISGSSVPTFVSIEYQFADWYIQNFGKDIDKDKVIPVMRAIQNHLESVRHWENLINQIFNGMGFTNTTPYITICIAVYNPTGDTIYLLRQVDDFLLAC